MSTDVSHEIFWMCFFGKNQALGSFFKGLFFFGNGPIEFRKVVNVMHVESFELLWTSD